MAFEFKVVRRVEFGETDMAGIMHFSNYFRFMETVEHGFFRSLGFCIVMHNFEPPIGWPRVHAECDYRLPLRFEDEVEIHLLVAEKKSKSLSYQIRFRRLNGAVPTEVARGIVTTVCVRLGLDSEMKAIPIPKAVSDRIQVAPRGLLG